MHTYAHIYIFICAYMCSIIYYENTNKDPKLSHFNLLLYSKTSLNRPTMGQTLNGPVRDVAGLGS